MPTYAVLVEHAAKALAFKRLRNYGHPIRWPADKDDTLADREGVSPIAWHFAEECRAEAQAMLEGIGITWEHDQIAADPITVHAGRVCHTARTRYIMHVDRDDYDVLLSHGWLTSGIDYVLRHHSEAEGTIHLVQTKQGEGIAFDLSIEHDTPEERDKIAGLITRHIQKCQMIKTLGADQ